MNFSEDEKPIVLIGVDLMIQAEQRRERDRQRGVGWGCKQANGSLNYVDHVSRDTVYCPQCTPLLGHPHRCFWIGDPKKATARYFRVRMLPVLAEVEKMYNRTLTEILEDLKAYQAKAPYQRQSGKLRDYRRMWKRGDAVAIEHYIDGSVSHLNVLCETRDLTVGEIMQVKAAVRGVFAATMVPNQRVKVGDNPEHTGDDKRIARFVLVKVEQAAMVLA